MVPLVSPARDVEIISKLRQLLRLLLTRNREKEIVSYPFQLSNTLQKVPFTRLELYVTARNDEWRHVQKGLEGLESCAIEVQELSMDSLGCKLWEGRDERLNVLVTNWITRNFAVTIFYLTWSHHVWFTEVFGYVIRGGKSFCLPVFTNSLEMTGRINLLECFIIGSHVFSFF